MKKCSKCHILPAYQSQKGGYCKSCHAAYVRAWNKKHPRTPEQKRRNNARSYAKIYLQRGKIKRQGCIKCGNHAEMHHPDYSKPRDIVWLCRKHHLLFHKEHGYS